MKPGELREMLSFRRDVERMDDEELARALWEVRVQDYIPRNSADEVVLDEAVRRLRNRETSREVAPSQKMEEAKDLLDHVRGKRDE